MSKVEKPHFVIVGGGLGGALMANYLGRAGYETDVYEMRGDLKEALTLWTRARDLYEKIGMPHMVAKMQNWLDELP